MKTKQKKETYQILAAVLISMAIIVIIWSIYFLPHRESDKEDASGFGNFTKEIMDSLSVFKNKTEAQDNLEINVDDLRERVFGDKIER